jgi:phosphoglycerate kinase
MIAKMTLEDIEVSGKTVLVRVDYNVPFTPGTLDISDDSRIVASLDTLRYLIDRDCRVVLCSHVGRPKGSVVEELRVRPIATRLSELLGRPVAVAPDCVGPEVASIVEALSPGGVVLLENLRFHPEEEKNDAAFAQELASIADLFVNDAFGAAHRAHASTEGVTENLPAVSGFLMARELEMLGRVLDDPNRPLVAVLGGAKASDKLAALRNLVSKADTLIVGGGMAATFLLADGLEVGDSMVEEDNVPMAREIVDAARRTGVDLLLPSDAVVADAFSEDAAHKVVGVDAIPAGWRIMDIGPLTANVFVEALATAGTVVWNGPMGVSEWKSFAKGTARIAEALAGLAGTTTVIGGGSTAEAVAGLGLANAMTHVSTGGGASLEFLEGQTLPGVAALMPAVNRQPR